MPAPPQPTADPDARMTPAVRRLLREHDLAAAQIVGTGGGGRITREDVLKVVEAIRTGRPGPGGCAAGTGTTGNASRTTGGPRPHPPAAPARQPPAPPSSSRMVPTKSSSR